MIAKRVRTEMRRPRLGRAFVLGAVVLTFSIGLSGCIGSGYSYISHRNPDGTILGFKIPSNWRTFDTDQIIEAANGPLSKSEEQSVAAGVWETVFSPSKKASANAFSDAENLSYPVGIAIATELNGTDRDAFNYSSMRAALIGTDPLEASSPDPYNVTAYNEFSDSGGLRGSKLATNIKLSNGSTAVISQIVETDANTEWVYAIGVECRAVCWGPNAGVIKTILNSWAVKPSS